jgi:hypothetical protein
VLVVVSHNWCYADFCNKWDDNKLGDWPSSSQSIGSLQNQYLTEQVVYRTSSFQHAVSFLTFELLMYILVSDCSIHIV